MAYTITNIHTNARHPGHVYAELRDETGALVIDATLDYILMRLALTSQPASIDASSFDARYNPADWLGSLYRDEP